MWKARDPEGSHYIKKSDRQSASGFLMKCLSLTGQRCFLSFGFSYLESVCHLDFVIGPLFDIWVLSFAVSSAVPGKAAGSTSEVRDFAFFSD